MVKSGSYEVKQGNIFGRIGTGLGKGLADQLPKEIDRGRLASGLQKFEKESGELTPLQQYTRLAAIPGITPQMIQALPEVLKQQNRAKALVDQSNSQNQSNPFSSQHPSTENQPSSGLTTRPGIEATRKGYIPKTYQQILSRAGELYNENSQLYNNDPQKAIEAAQQEESQNQSINQAYQDQRKGEQNIQNAVQSNLQTQSGLLNAKVPPNVYSDIEQRAIRSVLPVEEGGEGLTDQEAKIKYGNELDEISRDYSNLRAIGNWALPFQKPSEILRNLNSSRKSFKEKDDLRNFADTLVSENGLSNSKAYYLAYQPSDFPELNKTLSKIPDVNPEISYKSGSFQKKSTDYNPDAILHKISPKLAKDMGKDGSPLAVAEELSSKGYDPAIFLNYLDENRKKLDLTPRQVDELAKPRNFFPTLNDIWLFKKIGKDKLVE
jgi:hypothetical protein